MTHKRKLSRITIVYAIINKSRNTETSGVDIIVAVTGWISHTKQMNREQFLERHVFP